MERPISAKNGGTLTINDPNSPLNGIDTSGLFVLTTEMVKLWLVWPAESCATMVTERSPASLAAGTEALRWSNRPSWWREPRTDYR